MEIFTFHFRHRTASLFAMTLLMGFLLVLLRFSQSLCSRKFFLRLFANLRLKNGSVPGPFSASSCDIRCRNWPHISHSLGFNLLSKGFCHRHCHLSVVTQDYTPCGRLFGGYATRGEGATMVSYRFREAISPTHSFAATRPSDFAQEPLALDLLCQPFVLNLWIAVVILLQVHTSHFIYFSRFGFRGFTWRRAPFHRPYPLHQARLYQLCLLF